MKTPGLRYLLDTNACIAIRNSFRSREPADPARREAMRRLVVRWRSIDAAALAMSFVSYAELQLWCEKHVHPEKARAAVQKLAELIPVLGAATGAEGGQADRVAEHYARIRAALERAGLQIGGNDLWIAAHAAALDLTVVTGNTSEFARVPGLRCEDWTA